MKRFESALKSRDGIDFHVRIWEPDSKPRGLIALIHGLGEHGGRYEHVAKTMTDASYAMVSFDLRGHGQSSGIRGHFPSLDAAMQDIKDFLVFLTGRYPEIPHFLYGHSLGGLLVLTYALKNKPLLMGVIATSPGLRSPLTEQKFKILLVKLLSSIAPTALLASGLETAAISHDQAVIDTYNSDPLSHDRVSLAFGRTGLTASDYVWSHAQEFTLPLLLMHGTGDRITYSHGSESFSKLAGRENQDVTLKLWEDLYHELHNEPQQAQVLKFMIDWLDKHCK